MIQKGLFLNSQDKIAIDEVQRAPDLLLPIKKSVDRNKSPGRFLLTGSANILSHPRVKESLAGRMAIIDLEGLSYNESHAKAPSSFLKILFSNDSFNACLQELEATQQKRLDREDLNQCIFFGSFPDINLKKDLTFR